MPHPAAEVMAEVTVMVGRCARGGIWEHKVGRGELREGDRGWEMKAAMQPRLHHPHPTCSVGPRVPLSFAKWN